MSGVGPVTAGRIVAAFGASTFEVLGSADAVSRLSSLDKIGPATAAKIVASYAAGAGAREAHSFLVSELGLCERSASRAVALLGGASAVAAVRADPFAALAAVRGATFEEADRAAARLGKHDHDPPRLAAAVADALAAKGAADGHAFLPWSKAAAAAARALGKPRHAEPHPDSQEMPAVAPPVTAAQLAAAARAAARRGALVIEDDAAGAQQQAAAAAATAAAAAPARPAYRRSAPFGDDGDDDALDSLPISPTARVYLPELHSAELVVASALAARCGHAPLPPPAWLPQWLDAQQAARGCSLSSEQRDAVGRAASSPALVVCGGPGTGKTLVVALTVALWRAQGKRVRLAAPTGRAAQRMAELLDTIGGGGGGGGEAQEPPSTIHRLLEFIPREDAARPAASSAAASTSTSSSSSASSASSASSPSSSASASAASALSLAWEGRFARCARHPLECDALVIDEASMLDLPLAAALLSSLPPRCQLLLVGDDEQLPPVGPGSPLRDAMRPDSGVPVARLQEVFRQAAGSLMVRAAVAINAGTMPPLAPVYLPEEEGEEAGGSGGAPPPIAPSYDPFAARFDPVHATASPIAAALAAGYDALWVRLSESSQETPAAAQHVSQELAPPPPRSPPPPPHAPPERTPSLPVLAALIETHLPAVGMAPGTQLQVLVPMRVGPHGATSLCAHLAPLLNPLPRASHGAPRPPFAVGDRVLQVANDYDKEVFNGDLGRVKSLFGRSGVVVDFGGRAVEYDDGEAREALSHAWAVTVHKAQGSEFEAVVLVLHSAHGYLLSRRLLYTAASRASKLLIVVSPPSALQQAVRTVRDDSRHSHLGPRLAAARAARSPPVPPPPPRQSPHAVLAGIPGLLQGIPQRRKPRPP